MSYMGMGAITDKDFEELDYLIEDYLPKKEEIWLFGTGRYAQAFYEFLKTCDIKITGFVVSKVEEQCPFSSEPIISIEELRERYKEKNLTVLLTVGGNYYGEVYPQLMFLGDDLYFLKSTWKEYAVDRCATDDIILSIHITDFCYGIACYGCGVGSPIAEKNIYEMEQFKKDNYKIKELLGERIKRMCFTGGDVFLHPQLLEMTEFIRTLYPDIEISFLINGILIEKQSDEFWKRMGKCRVRFEWTLYPIKYPDLAKRMKEIETLSEGGVLFTIIGDSMDEDKTSWTLPFSFHKQKKQDRLFCCFHKDNKSVLQLRSGKLAVCYPAMLLPQLHKKFKENLTDEFMKNTAQELISLDVDNIKSPEEIYEFMKKRHTVCDYCAIRERKSVGKWMRSRGEFSEWFVEDILDLSK